MYNEFAKIVTVSEIKNKRNKVELEILDVDTLGIATYYNSFVVKKVDNIFIVHDLFEHSDEKLETMQEVVNHISKKVFLDNYNFNITQKPKNMQLSFHITV